MREYDIRIFKQSDVIFKRYNDLLEKGIEPVIIDCGANSGMATLWWKRLFPKAKIIAIEADENNYAALINNTNGYSKIECISAAVWGRRTKVVLSNPLDEAWAFRFDEGSSNAIDSKQRYTETITINEIIDDHKIHNNLILMKIDIEGGEKNLFSENVSWLGNVPLLIIETHDSLQPYERTSQNFFKEIVKYDVEMCFYGENAFAYILN